ncbi:MAG: hypothetical protein P1V81_11250 [Planctomycetota bacterium]|nr:hypothetical protein [Planctomycetota bacterium]
MVEKENLAIGPLFTVSGITVFFVIAIILALTGLNDFEQRRLKAGFNAKLPADTLRVEAEQKALVEDYSKDADGNVRIPVEAAMDMILEERKDG